MSTGLFVLPITSAGWSHAAAGVWIPVVRLWVGLWFNRQGGTPMPRRCLLDTGAPLSIIPFEIHQKDQFAWQPLPGPWPRGFTTWMGVPCTVGRIDAWP